MQARRKGRNEEKEAERVNSKRREEGDKGEEKRVH